MKLKKSERIAIAITAAFLLLVIGIRIGSAKRSVPVTVRTEQQTPAQSMPSAGSAAVTPQDAPVNLNTATKEQLQTLDGVGAVLAGRIIEYREAHGPFAAVEDITRVQGIAEKVYQENYARMCVD